MMFHILVITAILAYYMYVKITRRNLPPGPFPYPLIGSAIEVAMIDMQRPYVALHEMSKQYGKIYSIKIGVVDNVVVNGHEMLKQVLIMDNINDRASFDWSLDRSYGSAKYGLFFSSTQHWKDNRRYTQKTLKDFGFGKMKSMDELILEEFQVLVERIKRSTASNNGILRIELVFNAAFVNIIYSFLTGTRFDQDDPKLAELVKLANDWVSASNIGLSALGAYPFLKDWAPDISGFTLLHNSNERLLDYFTNLVRAFRQRGDYKTNPRSFIEVGLKNIDEGTQNDSYETPVFTEKNLICLLNDIFAAGSETSANSTAFAVRRLVQHPDIQKKIQDEIDRVVGRDRWVTLSDKPNLAFTEAFTLEVLRRDSVAPLVQRSTINACKIDHYDIPVDTNILLNYYSASMDKTVWGDPEIFRPERFINSKGLYNTEKLTVFSFGKRDCIGQSVAKNTLFMAVACFAQHLTFQVDPTTGMPDDRCTKAASVSPVPFNTLVKCR